MESVTQSEIDKLTLELMVPKSKYRKYLAKQDPSLLQEFEDKHRNYYKYRETMHSIAKQWIDHFVSDSIASPDNTTSEIMEIMERFVEKCGAHLKTVEETTPNCDEEYEYCETDESIMFDPAQMETNTSNYTGRNGGTSMWGKPVFKLDGTLKNFVSRK